MSDDKISLEHFILNAYQELVSKAYPNFVQSWPVLCGYDLKKFRTGDYIGVVFLSTRNSGMVTSHGLGELDPQVFGLQRVDNNNIELLRERAIKYFRLTADDAVVFVTTEGFLANNELVSMLRRHERAMNLSPDKIFLSHKGADKPLVREYERTLRALGFDPWLDELSMSAGAELERALLRGFNESCAVVFFVTPNYVDEAFLATEVDYAIAEKRKKGDRFSIITIVLSDPENKAKVPDLLHKYVWKKPSGDLEALREIISALPIKLGDTMWR